MSTDESIELEDEDFEEPPPTDPCPGVIPNRSDRVDPSDDDLEKRLAWLAAEVRTTSAEQAKIRREKTVLERREYKNSAIATDSKLPQDTDLPKVTLAVGVDPKRDPTLVGRRSSENQWDFDVSDPEELSRTLPLDTQAAIADPLPFPTSADKPTVRRGASWSVLAGLCLVFLSVLMLQYFVHSSTRAAFAEIPMAKRAIVHAATQAELHYHQAKNAEEAGLLIPRFIQSGSEQSKPVEMPSAPAAMASSAAPKWLLAPSPTQKKIARPNKDVAPLMSVFAPPNANRLMEKP